MKVFSYSMGALVIGVVSGWGGCRFSTRQNQEYQPIEEAKICYINLTQYHKSLSPQLREYLKARLYSTSANYINEGWLDGWKIDFGPVDDEVLSIYAIKNASPTEAVYEVAMERHPRSAILNPAIKAR